METREIRLKTLLWQGMAYRLFSILVRDLGFFWIILGDLGRAIGVSLAASAVDMVFYYLFHYFWARVFRLGRG
jgi:hypothetical protein